MKKISITWLLPVVCILGISCARDDDGPEVFSFTGKAQKGPFVTGTTITLNELNKNLGQTGKSFTSTITSDDGSFKLNNIELNSNLALITANGFYFSELYGNLSSATLSLQTIADLSKKETVNINVMTHIIKGRIEKLVNNGQTFHDAYVQAKSEFLAFLNVNEPFEQDFDELDISQSNDWDAVLLAFSIILQRFTIVSGEWPTLTAELTQLLTNLGTDFSDDGLINNQSLIDTLIYNISQLELIKIRSNIEKRYSDLGMTVSIADFERYLNRFQEKHSKILYTNFYYPPIAPGRLIDTESKLQNLLYSDDTIYQCTSYSIAACTPLYSTLKIKFIETNFDPATQYYHWGGFTATGWTGTVDPDGITFISQRQNTLMTTYIYFDSPGTATVEYYENNNSETPTFTKNIKWE